MGHTVLHSNKHTMSTGDHEFQDGSAESDNEPSGYDHSTPPNVGDRSRFGYDPVERFVVPRLPGLPGIATLRMAIRQAVDHRTGVVVTGPLGYGKSEGIHAGRAEHAMEQRLCADQNPRYHRTRVSYVNLRTAKTKRQLLADLLQPGAPGRRLQGHIRGERKTDDQLRDELYQLYTRQGVAALIVDDAQRLSDAGLELFRDLIAGREEDPHRTVIVDDVPGSPAVGVGVVLVGTPELKPRVIKTGETHGRGLWGFDHEVPALAESQLARVYEAIFPGFAPHIEATTLLAWKRFIESHVGRGRKLPIRLVARHAREYFARLYDQTRGTVTSRTEAHFDRSLFIATLKAVEWEKDAERFPAPRTDSTSGSGDR